MFSDIIFQFKLYHLKQYKLTAGNIYENIINNKNNMLFILLTNFKKMDCLLSWIVYSTIVTIMLYLFYISIGMKIDLVFNYNLSTITSNTILYVSCSPLSWERVKYFNKFFFLDFYHLTVHINIILFCYMNWLEW
jgi:hypothetical protein